MSNATVDTDCFGRYFSDSAAECKICRDASMCRKKTVAAGFYVAPVIDQAPAGVAQVYSVPKVVEMLSAVGFQGCTYTAKKASVTSGDVRYLDVVVGGKGMQVYCSYSLPGLARFSNTDARPFKGNFISYQSLQQLLSALYTQVQSK